MAAPQADPGGTLAPVTESDFAVLRELASTIWRQHYTGIISAAQIDYMLAGRFSDEALHEQMASRKQKTHFRVHSEVGQSTSEKNRHLKQCKHRANLHHIDEDVDIRIVAEE